MSGLTRKDLEKQMAEPLLMSPVEKDDTAQDSISRNLLNCRMCLKPWDLVRSKYKKAVYITW